MLKTMNKNKKYIVWAGIVCLFGIAGLLLAPVAMCVIKISKRYPKAVRRIAVGAFAFVGIYGFLFRREWNMSDVSICICIVLAIDSALKNNGR